jgi:hypothetical protein
MAIATARPQKAAVKKTAGIVTLAGGTALAKTAGIKVIKAKTAKLTMAKTTVATTTVLTRGAAISTQQPALTRGALKKRQQAKSTTRKQGGAKFTLLPAQKIKAMASKFEAGPTAAE